jgi:flagellin
MNSINTNFAALTALQSLNDTNKELNVTQARISTGYRVGSASDDAAYWSMATTLRSDNKSLSAVSDALGLGAATIDVAYTAMNSAVDVVSEMKAKLVAAREPGVDRSKVQTEVDELQNQLRSIAASASFSGENWLMVDTGGATYSATESVVSAFSRAQGANGAETTIATIAISVSTMFLFDANSDGAGGGFDSGAATADALGILGSARLTRADADAAGVARGSVDAAGTIVIASAFDPESASAPGAPTAPAEIDISLATDEELEDFIQAVDAALADMTTAATELGSSQKRIDLQRDFVQSLMDAIDRGVSALVDADMNAESTRLQALQVQQQLGVQALSIANSQSQNILSLFRG